MWDCAITTDRAIEANKLDIVLFDKIKNKAIIIDVEVASDDKLQSTIAETKRKDQALSVELKDI